MRGKQAAVVTHRCSSQTPSSSASIRFVGREPQWIGSHPHVCHLQDWECGEVVGRRPACTRPWVQVQAYRSMAAFLYQQSAFVVNEASRFSLRKQNLSTAWDCQPKSSFLRVEIASCCDWGALHQSANPLTWGRINGVQSGGTLGAHGRYHGTSMWEGEDSHGHLSFCFTKEELANAELPKVSSSRQV